MDLVRRAKQATAALAIVSTVACNTTNGNIQSAPRITSDMVCTSAERVVPTPAIDGQKSVDMGPATVSVETGEMKYLTKDTTNESYSSDVAGFGNVSPAASDEISDKVWKPAEKFTANLDKPWQNLILEFGDVADDAGSINVTVNGNKTYSFDVKDDLTFDARGVGSVAIPDTYVTSFSTTSGEGIPSHVVTAFSGVSCDPVIEERRERRDNGNTSTPPDETPPPSKQESFGGEAHEASLTGTHTQPYRTLDIA